MRLSTRVAGIPMETPVMNASGVVEWSPSTALRLVREGSGAVVLKSVTREPRAGYGRPRVHRFGGTLINAVGLANPGVEEASRLTREIKGALGGRPLIASVAGSSVEEFVEVASRLEDAGADAVELNLSCPHFGGGGLEIAQDRSLSSEIVREVSGVLGVPVVAKLGLVDDLPGLASALLSSGASALTLINSVRGMRIDVYSSRPVLSNVVGGVSGEAILPLAVRAVYEVYRETGADIMGAGGVSGWEGAVEMLMAGARAVQVGAAILLRGPAVIREILDGLERFMFVQGYSGLEELVGAAQRR